MRLLITVPWPWDRRLGGAENLLWTFLRHVNRERIEPCVVFFEPGDFEREVSALGLRTYVLPGGRLREVRPAVKAVLQLSAILRHERPDLILNWTSKSHIHGAIAARIAGMTDRLVWWQHGVPGSESDTGIWIERLATLLPARVVICSSMAGAVAQRRLRPRRRTVVIHPGVEALKRLSASDLEDLRATLGIPDGRLVLGIVGRLVPWKGHDRFFEMLADLRSRGHAVHGLVIGGGTQNIASDFEQSLRRLVERLNLSGHVTFTGQVADAGPFYQLLDIAFNLSHGESLSLAILEALSLGMPLVAIDAGGTAEILDNGKSGVLVPPRDGEQLRRSVEALLRSKQTRVRIGKAARLRFLEAFTAERLASDLERVLWQGDLNGSIPYHHMIEKSQSRPYLAPGLGRKPRVTLVAHEVHQGGGQERACWELVRRASRDVDFTVVSIALSKDIRNLVRWRRVPDVRRPAPLTYLLFFCIAGIKVRRSRPDIVHTIGAIVPNRVDLATVQFCHAGYRERTGHLAAPDSSLIRRLNTSATRLLGIAGESWCYRPGRTRLFAPVSSGVQRELEDLYPGIPAKVTPNGVDLGRFRPDPAVRRGLLREERVAPDAVVALFVGGDWHRKGLAIAIQALAVAERRLRKPIMLWVVGRGEERPFRNLAQQNGIGDRIRFFGFRSDEHRFYQAADILVTPSLYETFSLAAFQAAACGLPVIGTRVSGIEDLIGADEAGLIVDRTPGSVGQALVRLAADPELRARLGAEGRRRAENHTWDRSVASVLDCYRRLLDVPARQKLDDDGRPVTANEGREGIHSELT